MRLFLRFGRPHTLLATSLQVVAVFVLVVPGWDTALKGGAVLFWAWAASLAANIYVVGLNQITDVAIDKVNKPHLPLAAAAYTLPQAWVIVLATGLGGLMVGWWQSITLLLTVALVMLIGSVYSLRPWRLKQRPFWAAFSIAFARGMVANLGLYLHFRGALMPVTAGFSPLLLGMLFFFFGFGLVIALYKDVPDCAGDGQHAVFTFAVRLGQKRVFDIGRWLLTALYLLPIIWGLLAWPGLVGVALSLVHALALAVFWLLSTRVEPEQPTSMMRFYLFLWGLFYLEYLLLSFGGVVAWLRL